MNYLENSLPNIFTSNFYLYREEDGHYNPLSGSEYYENQLIPATSVMEDGEPMKGKNMNLWLGNQGNPVSISCDYAFFNAPALASYLPPSGDFYWTWRNEAQDLIQRLGQPSNNQPTSPVSVITLNKQSSSSTFLTITGFSQGWQLVYEEDSIAYVINSDYWLWRESEQNVIKISTSARIIGCYKVYTTWSQDAIDQLTASSYRTGYHNGEIAGREEANTTLSPFTYIKSTASAIGSFLDLTILPGLSIGALLCVPLVVLVFATIVRILKK